MSKEHLLFIILLLACFACTRPLGVTHWNAKSRRMVMKSLHSRKKNAYGYPKHTYLSFIVCFNESCINRAETINFRKKHRFKGFKNNAPIQKRVPEEKEDTIPVIAQQPEQAEEEITLIVNKVYRFTHVYFETGKADLNTESKGELEQIALYLQKNPKLTITVSGHTDNTGDEMANAGLSQLRAEAVTRYLAAKGIAAQRLFANGSTQPLTANDTEQGREKNRRVEFIIKEAN